MSSFECKVYKLIITEHPNADAIELAQIGDYRSIVRKGEFKTGDLCVYIPEAAIVPDWILENMGLTDKLAGKDKNRVKAIKLRGILSQGLVYPATTLGEDVCVVKVAQESKLSSLYKDFHVGDDLTEVLGIEKYVPKIPTSMNGEVFNAFGMTLKYDVENIKKFPDVFEDGEEVSFTEKLHGTWCCFGYHPDCEHPIITSKGLSDRGLAFKMNDANSDKNLYVRMFNKIESGDGWLNILELFLEANKCNGWDQWEERGDEPFYILGEIFGAGIQDLTYGKMPAEFRVFDIYVGEPGKGTYMNTVQVHNMVGNMRKETTTPVVSCVPELYKGPFSKEVLDEYTDGKETASGNEAHMREGIVIRPLTERRHDEIGRVMLKSVSEKYLLRKNATEYT